MNSSRVQKSSDHSTDMSYLLFLKFIDLHTTGAKHFNHCTFFCFVDLCCLYALSLSLSLSLSRTSPPTHPRTHYKVLISKRKSCNGCTICHHLVGHLGDKTCRCNKTCRNTEIIRVFLVSGDGIGISKDRHDGAQIGQSGHCKRIQSYRLIFFHV